MSVSSEQVQVLTSIKEVFRVYRERVLFPDDFFLKKRGKAAASDLPKIEHTIEVNSSRDRLWEIIPDVDNEGEYWWGTKSIQNLSKDGNVINREITQNFRNSRIKQKVILHPKDSVEVQYIKGITEGVKILSIETLAENRQRLKAYWDVRFPGVYRITTPLVKSHVEKGTIGALERIKNAAEGKLISTQEKARA